MIQLKEFLTICTYHCSYTLLTIIIGECRSKGYTLHSLQSTSEKLYYRNYSQQNTKKPLKYYN